MKALRTIALAAAGIVALVPLVWMVSTSLKSNQEITQDGTLFPHTPTLQNYRNLFSDHDYGSYLTNSLGITAISVLVSLVLGTLAAYSIARYRLRSARSGTSASAC